MSKIFISHASNDRGLALLVKRLLEDALDIPKSGVSLFCSSEVRDIPGGKEWLKEIMAHLGTAKACVSIMTPHSVHFSEWVSYESGGAYLKFASNPKKTQLFPTCAYGISTSTLPSTFGSLQARHLNSTEEVRALIDELAACVGIQACVVSDIAIAEVTTEASKGSPDWNYVSKALIGERQADSPFSFEALLATAKNTIFAAGFNLRHIGTSPECKEKVFRFLESSPNSLVRILISDLVQKELFHSWKLVGETYLNDLEDATRGFRGWIADAKTKNLDSRLDIRVSPFVALTLVCVDANSKHSQLVITPIVFGKPLSADRPHISILRAQQPVVFSYYFDSYQDLFSRAPRLSV